MKKPKPKFWWIAVDLDENETILAVATSIQELADIMGTSIHVISRKVWKPTPWDYRVEKIPIDYEDGDLEEDEEEEGD